MARSSSLASLCLGGAEPAREAWQSGSGCQADHAMARRAGRQQVPVEREVVREVPVEEVRNPPPPLLARISHAHAVPAAAAGGGCTGAAAAAGTA